jgi:hypothetical protein
MQWAESSTDVITNDMLTVVWSEKFRRRFGNAGSVCTAPLFCGNAVRFSRDLTEYSTSVAANIVCETQQIYCVILNKNYVRIICALYRNDRVEPQAAYILRDYLLVPAWIPDRHKNHDHKSAY